MNARSLRAVLPLVSLLISGCAEPTVVRTGNPSAPGVGLVFSSDRDGRLQLYTVGVDGSGMRRLFVSDREERHPRVSPDGRLIAYTSIGAGGSDVWVVGADGTNPRPLTRTGRSSQPTWSPDGRRLAFVVARGRSERIHVVGVDGEGLRALSPDGAMDRSPAWSPVGDLIAFSAVADGHEDVYVMSADGTGRRRLTSAPGEDSRPAWMPDGKSLLYNHSSRDIHDDVWRVAIDGSKPRPVNESREERARYVDRNRAAWAARPSPDGRLIVFTSIRTGTTELWLMPVTGEDPRQLTDDDAHDDDADWLRSR